MKNFKELREFNLADSAMTFVAFTVAVHLKKDFVDWEAYKLGLIDENGKIIKDPKTTDEKEALGKTQNFARKIKIVVQKYIGSSKIIAFMIAAYLMKNESIAITPYIVDELNHVLNDDEQELLYNIVEIFYREKY